MSTHKENFTVPRPLGKRKRRSSILKSAKPLEQDLHNLTQFDERSRRSKRVSFSTTIRVKEFQLPSQHASQPGSGDATSDGKKEELLDDMESFVQMSTPVKKKKRRISTRSGAKIERFSIIPPLERSFIALGDEKFEEAEYDHVTSDCTAPKEDITLSEPSDFEAYADDNDMCAALAVFADPPPTLAPSITAGEETMDITCSESSMCVAEPASQPPPLADFIRQLQTAAKPTLQEANVDMDTSLCTTTGDGMSLTCMGESVVPPSPALEDSCMSMSFTCFEAETATDLQRSSPPHPPLATSCVDSPPEKLDSAGRCLHSPSTDGVSLCQNRDDLEKSESLSRIEPFNICRSRDMSLTCIQPSAVALSFDDNVHGKGLDRSLPRIHDEADESAPLSPLTETCRDMSLTCVQDPISCLQATAGGSSTCNDVASPHQEWQPGTVGDSTTASADNPVAVARVSSSPLALHPHDDSANAQTSLTTVACAADALPPVAHSSFQPLQLSKRSQLLGKFRGMSLVKASPHLGNAHSDKMLVQSALMQPYGFSLPSSGLHSSKSPSLTHILATKKASATPGSHPPSHSATAEEVKDISHGSLHHVALQQDTKVLPGGNGDNVVREETCLQVSSGGIGSGSKLEATGTLVPPGGVSMHVIDQAGTPGISRADSTGMELEHTQLLSGGAVDSAEAVQQYTRVLPEMDSSTVTSQEPANDEADDANKTYTILPDDRVEELESEPKSPTDHCTSSREVDNLWLQAPSACDNITLVEESSECSYSVHQDPIPSMPVVPESSLVAHPLGNQGALHSTLYSALKRLQATDDSQLDSLVLVSPNTALAYQPVNKNVSYSQASSPSPLVGDLEMSHLDKSLLYTQSMLVPPAALNKFLGALGEADDSQSFASSPVGLSHPGPAVSIAGDSGTTSSVLQVQPSPRKQEEYTSAGEPSNSSYLLPQLLFSTDKQSDTEELDCDVPSLTLPTDPSFPVCVDFDLANEAENLDYGLLLLELQECLNTAVILVDQRLTSQEYVTSESRVSSILKRWKATSLMCLHTVDLLVAYRELCNHASGRKQGAKSSISLPLPPLGGRDFSGSLQEKTQWMWKLVQVIQCLIDFAEDLLDQAGRYYPWKLISWSRDEVKLRVGTVMLRLQLEESNGYDQVITTVTVYGSDAHTSSPSFVNAVHSCTTTSQIAEMLWSFHQN